jgi:cytochrome b561
MPPRPAVYTPTARWLHWLTAGLLVALFGLGVSMTRWVGDNHKLRVYSWHEWVGVTVFGLTAFRLWWSMRHPPPPLSLAPLEHVARRVVHAAIYAVLILQPITGWIMSCAFGFPVVYLGVIPLPIIVEADSDLAARMQGIHDVLAVALVGLFTLHLGAVALHHLVRQDGLLARMAPRR